MGPFIKQLKNSEGTEMALRMGRAALGEMSVMVLLSITALIADELKKRCVAEIKRKLRSRGAK